MIVAIDIGKNGAIVVLNKQKKIINKYKIPKIGLEVDVKSYVDIILKHKKADLFVIEDVHAIFGASAKSTFSFGKMAMLPVAICSALKLPYKLVAPKTWQARIFKGMNFAKGMKPKDKAKLVFDQLYPNEVEKHDGIIDAVLIARSEL